MIKRYFEPKTLFYQIKKDFDFLVPLIHKYYGELEFSIRDNYFNLYYKGNSLAKVKPVNKVEYEVSINRKFTDKNALNPQPSKVKQDKRFSFIQKGANDIIRLKSGELHPFFQKKYLDDLCSRISNVNYGEEIVFEQSVITDNSDNKDFFIIDRQVTDTVLQRKRIDLLALRRLENGIYRIVVLEIKLGKNKELRHQVVGQLSHYTDHIKLHLISYADCYEENFKQKKALGLISIPYNSITIDRNDVEGIIVVGGYSKIAAKHIGTLKQTFTNITVKQFTYILP